MTPDPRPYRIATIGGAFSGNQGDYAMVQAVIENLPDHLGECRISVLTHFPEQDRRRNPYPDVAIVPLPPLSLVVPLLPLALFAAILRVIRVPHRWLLAPRSLRALDDADVVVDLSGISFAENRGLPTLLYNVLMAGIPILMGKPLVKCAQALGPFRSQPLRLAARLILPRVASIGARGDGTEAHLRELGLTDNVVQVDDLAFAIGVSEAERRSAADVVSGLGPEGPLVGVSPSSVVEAYCRDRGVDYPTIMGHFVEHLVGTGHRVVVFPHSAVEGGGEGRMNDLPVCRKVAAAAGSAGRDRQRCALVDRSMTPGEARAVIDECDLLVTSRFHAMVSSLAVATPVVVVGWSHKYAEVLRDFGLEEWVVDYADVSLDTLVERFGALHEQADAIRRSIDDALPRVVKGAQLNFEEIARVARSARDEPTSEPTS